MITLALFILTAVTATALVNRWLDAERNEGCDCTELCSMGPTCPGGGLAGLPGSGCWRTNPDDRSE